MTNTRSETLEFSLQNIHTPPFQLSVWESNEPINDLFQLQPYTPEEQKKFMRIFLGKSAEDRLIAFHVNNVGLCSLLCAHANDQVTESDNIKVRALPLSDTVSHLRLQISQTNDKTGKSPDAAFFIEEDSFQTTGYSRLIVRRVSITEIIDGQKTRRFEHNHIGDGKRVSTTWRLTNYSPILT